ncbi:NADH dehydrogenase [ubiquinone] 1 alpha subcomplex subunit 13 [Panulirus ornatus]|uniref:NADH dehydrogenase [ubiquinone] 1 alpha subcomplex subunit 13 n=1 Tax=Panulirus ornatus TaxID=150431 RepID=UPI003A84CD5C
MAAPTQDLPPKGGYAPISFRRLPARTYFSGLQMFAGYTILTAVTGFLYYRTYRRIRLEEVEMRSGQLAIEPLLLAERDREFLKQIRKNRDEEEKLMEGVEGWEVGKYYNEPIYKTVPEDKFLDPIVQEYFSHGHSKSYVRGAYFSLFV